MALKIIMLVILAYPLYASLLLCNRVWSGKSGGYIAELLITKLPKWLARAITVILFILVSLLMLLIIMMEPIPQ